MNWCNINDKMIKGRHLWRHTVGIHSQLRATRRRHVRCQHKVTVPSLMYETSTPNQHDEVSHSLKNFVVLVWF